MDRSSFDEHSEGVVQSVVAVKTEHVKVDVVARKGRLQYGKADGDALLSAPTSRKIKKSEANRITRSNLANFVFEVTGKTKKNTNITFQFQLIGITAPYKSQHYITLHIKIIYFMCTL